MSNRRTERFSAGQYQFPKFGDATQAARARLMEATRELLPRFLNELATDVFPSYVKFKEATDDSTKSTLEETMQHALTDWASRFHALESWITEGAIDTMDVWYRDPQALADRQWKPGAIFSIAIAEPFELKYPGWDMLRLTWAGYLEDVHRQVDKMAAEYKAEADRLAMSLGLDRAPRMYSPPNLEWFVLFQFAKLDYADILRQLTGRIDDSTVRKGVRKAQELLQWKSLRTT